MENALAELIEFVKAAAPEVWRILLRQVAVEVAINTWYVVASVATIVVLGRAVSADLKRSGGDPMEGNFFLTIFGGLAIVVAGFVLVTSVSLVIGHLINPEFYALQYLIEPLK